MDTAAAGLWDMSGLLQIERLPPSSSLILLLNEDGPGSNFKCQK